MSYLSSAQKLRPIIETAMDKVDDNTYAEHRLTNEKLEEMEKRLANGRCT